MAKRFRIKSLGRLDRSKRWESLGRGLKLKAMGLTLASFPPGEGYDRPHSHAIQEEVYLLLAGRGEMVIDGKLLRLKAGDVVAVDPAARRALRSAARARSSWLMVGAAAGSYRENDWTEYDEPAFPQPQRRRSRRAARGGGRGRGRAGGGRRRRG